MRIVSRPSVRACWVAALGLLLAACSAPAGAGSVAPVPSSSAPAPIVTPAPVPSSVTAADAVAIVLALDPRFAAVAARNPQMVGQGSWYVVTPDPAGWRVEVQVGSGDCPAGCIDRRTWVYMVGPDGSASMISETGDPLPTASAASEPPAPIPPAPSEQPGASSRPGATARPTPTREPAPSVAPAPSPGSGSAVPPVAIPSSGGPWLVGVATAGPVCPVARNPPDPACAPRPVSGATIVIVDQAGREVATATTSTDGTYRVAVPAGHVRIEPPRVAGLMRAPAPIDALIPAGAGAWLRVDLDYDTGIR